MGIINYVVVPVVSTFTVSGGTTHTETFPGVATYVQLTNTVSQDVTVAINGVVGATFNLKGNTSQIFHKGDMTISSLLFSNTISGATTAHVECIYGYVV